MVMVIRSSNIFFNNNNRGNQILGLLLKSVFPVDRLGFLFASLNLSLIFSFFFKFLHILTSFSILHVHASRIKMNWKKYFPTNPLALISSSGGWKTRFLGWPYSPLFSNY